MTVTVAIPIYGTRETGQNIQIRFPRHCVYCFRPVETEVSINLYGSASARGKRVEYGANLCLPYCREHAALDEQYQKQYQRWIVGIIGVGIVVGVAGFVMGGGSDTAWIMIPGLGGCAVLVLHWLLLRIFPKFREIPTGFQHGALGAIMKLNTTAKAASSLVVTFSNERYADEFRQLNAM